MIDQRKNQIVNGVIWKQLLIFFFPIMAGSFFQVFYNTVDAIVVGRYVGTIALAAVGGPTSTLINLVVGFFIGLSTGSAVVISQFFGAGDDEATSLAVHTSMALALAGGAVIGLLGVTLSRWALGLMNTPAEVMEPACRYLEIFLGGSIFSLVYNMGSSIMRAWGDSKRPFYFLVAGSLVNIAGDLLFVVRFGWGVAGVAWATLLSQAFSAAGVCVCLAREEGAFRLSLRKIRFNALLLRNIVAVGLPTGLQASMYSISNIVIQAAVNSFGVGPVAAWSVLSKIDALYWQMMAAFGMSVCTFSGQNFGARKYDRVRQSVRDCTIIAFIATVSVSVTELSAARFLFAVFTDDAEVIRLGVGIMWRMVPYYFTYVLLETMSGGIRGTGDSLMPTVMMALGICVFRLFWVWCVMPLFPDFLMLGWSYPISWTITTSAFVLYYRYSGWLERSIIRSGHSVPSEI